jgi:hypothetical protein
MTVIAIWVRIDGIIAQMLSKLVKSDLAVAVAMFHAIKSQDGQRQAVSAAAPMKRDGVFIPPPREPLASGVASL